MFAYTYIHAYIPGEIYNHEELYEQLLAEGHAVTRHTKTDSEVFYVCLHTWCAERPHIYKQLIMHSVCLSHPVGLTRVRQSARMRA